MAKRKKPTINGWMRRKKGMFKRFSRATVKVKTRVNFVQIPEPYTTRRPPKPDKRGTVLHDVPPTKRLSVERVETLTRKMEIEVKEAWTGYRHHGLINFNYKELESRGRPQHYWIRIYFKGDEALFIKYERGIHYKSKLYLGLMEAMAIYRRFGSAGIVWTQE